MENAEEHGVLFVKLLFMAGTFIFCFLSNERGESSK